MGFTNTPPFLWDCQFPREGNSYAFPFHGKISDAGIGRSPRLPAYKGILIFVKTQVFDYKVLFIILSRLYLSGKDGSDSEEFGQMNRQKKIGRTLKKSSDLGPAENSAYNGLPMP